MRLRYQPIPNLPTRCPRGEKVDAHMAMSRKKGGFMTLCHNTLRDITDALLEENQFYNQIIILYHQQQTNDGARLDRSARSFWITGQKVFFDVRVFDPKASQYQSKSLKQCFAVNELEKKRLYNKRISEVEHTSFTPLIFTIHGAMGIECRSFVSKLSELLAIKRNLPKSTVTSWVRKKISFALIKSMLICLRGSRSTKGGTMATNDIDAQENLTKIKRDIK